MKRRGSYYVEGLLILMIVAVLMALFWPVFCGYRDKVAAEKTAATTGSAVAK